MVSSYPPMAVNLHPNAPVFFPKDPQRVTRKGLNGIRTAPKRPNLHPGTRAEARDALRDHVLAVH